MSPVTVSRKKGGRITFFCEVDYHDNSYNIEWSFYGLPLPTNAKHVYDMDLVIDEITYDNGGDYICLVSTEIGYIVSAKGHLIVESVLVIVQ